MVDIGIEDRKNPFLGCLRLFQALGQQGLPFRQPVFEIAMDEIGLGGKVVVEAHLGDAGFCRDRVDAGGGDAIGIEELGGGVEQLFAGGGSRHGDSELGRLVYLIRRDVKRCAVCFSIHWHGQEVALA